MGRGGTYHISIDALRVGHSICSADGSTHTEREIEGIFFLRVSHAKRTLEPTERLASTHIHTSFQH